MRHAARDCLVTRWRLAARDFVHHASTTRTLVGKVVRLRCLAANQRFLNSVRAGTLQSFKYSSGATHFPQAIENTEIRRSCVLRYTMWPGPRVMTR